jgi:hypothetical protein
MRYLNFFRVLGVVVSTRTATADCVRRRHHDNSDARPVPQFRNE